jgi:hypothetical protein
MAALRKVLAMVGGFLLALSGQTHAAPDQASTQDKQDDAKIRNAAILPSSVSAPEPIQLAQHANSGPTTHTNQPGHANFTKKLSNPQHKLAPAQIQILQQRLGGGGAAASHVNSGPTTHTNQPGHANFTKKLSNPQQKLNPSQIRQLQQRLEGQGTKR